MLKMNIAGPCVSGELQALRLLEELEDWRNPTALKDVAPDDWNAKRSASISMGKEVEYLQSSFSRCWLNGWVYFGSAHLRFPCDWVM